MELSKNDIRQIALEVDAEDLPVRTLKQAVVVLQKYHAQVALDGLKLAELTGRDAATDRRILADVKAAEALQEYLRILLGN